MSFPAPPPGSLIAGKYRVERVLGTGGMAVVVEATHAILGQRVAIKILRSDAARAPSVLERFQQEAQIAAQLPGDHVVRVTDVGQTDTGEPFIVMELLVGRDLEAEILARGCLPMEEAVDMILQACEGVAEAHAVGLVHRDLKPGNLFVMRRRDGSPLLKVLDFGISKLTRRDDNVSLTQATDNFGTPLYMSPEQIQSAKNVDARSDQHALAAILFTLLAGQPPWNAPTVPALSVLIAMQPPPSLRSVRPDVSSRLEQAIERALAKQPGDRFADLAAFAYALVPFGSAGSQASVRRIASALASSAPPFQGSDPRPSDQGYMPVAGAPPPAPSNPEVGIHISSGLHAIPRGISSNPGMPAPPPPMIAPPSFVGQRGPMGQTSSALTTALGSDRAAAARRTPLAIAFVTLTALSVALVVALVLLFLKPKRSGDASAQAASESAAASVVPATMAAPAEPPAAPVPPPPEPVAPAPEPSAPEPAAPEPSATASAAAASTAPAAVTAPTSPPAPWPKPVSATSKPVSTTSKPSATPKKRDPGDVFGSKR